jgi:hypothetical protein
MEVGCGCGAITRFLGETFDNIVAIEGSLVRARLARLRTKDMDNVSIICAPFQEIKFKERFDIIFCIGVFEYSSMYVDSPEPFNFILKYFHDLLTPDGEVIIAIENQFGLKYFSSSKEDHNDIMFDGLEGYPRYAYKEKTFGYEELKKHLAVHFNNIDYYFPYPDYKTPSCILSERFFCKVKAGEFIGGFKPSSYLDCQKPLFDERLVQLELDKNNMLPFFSNSFLIIAGKQKIISSKLKYLGIAYSNNRLEEFQTVISFTEDENNNILVEKKPANGKDKIESIFITLHKDQSNWIDGLSLHAQLRKRVKEKNVTIDELFAPCKIWLNTIKSLASHKNGACLLDGKYIDCIWINSFIIDGECKFIDFEWEWHEKISMNILLIRSLYEFLNDVSSMSDLNPALKIKSRRALIVNIAKSLGVVINGDDFKEFCKLESRLGQSVYGENYIRCWLHIYFDLWNKSISTFVLFNVNILKNILRIFHNIILKLGYI